LGTETFIGKSGGAASYTARVGRPPGGFSAILAIASMIAAAGAPSVATGSPSLPPCALGTNAPDLRGFAARELARAERRLGGGPRARRAFSAAAAAYVYGVAPLSVGQTVQRFPQNQMLSIGALVDPTVKTVVAPNVDTT
jgi:hypothetical protein